MKQAVAAVMALSFLTAGLSAQAQITYQPAPVAKAQVFTLEAREGVTCANGTLSWPAAFTFPAGFIAPLPAPKPATSNSEPIVFRGSPVAENKVYTLSFDVLANGRMTNIRPMGGDYRLFANEFLPTWAAGWNFGPQSKALTGCKMTWDIKTDYTPEAAKPLMYEAAFLRNFASGLRPADPRSDDCKAVDRRIRLNAYPDREQMRRTPGHSQWLVLRTDVQANGKVKVGGRLRASGEEANLEAVEKALSQRAYYPGEAAECLTGYVIPAEGLPWEGGAGDDGTQADKANKDAEEEKTCPAEARRAAMTFSYRPEYFPTQASRLGVEGVALLTFDVAPWGQVRVKSSTSHPLPQFAQAASRMLTQSRFKPTDRGLSGCRLLVRFVLDKDDKPEAAAPEASESLEDSTS